MLYAAAVTEVNGSKKALPWLLVHEEIYENNKAGSPFVYTKSEIEKIRSSVWDAMKRAKKGNGCLKIWARGQGVREVKLTDVTNISIIRLNPEFITDGPCVVRKDDKTFQWKD